MLAVSGMWPDRRNRSSASLNPLGSLVEPCQHPLMNTRTIVNNSHGRQLLTGRTKGCLSAVCIFITISTKPRFENPSEITVHIARFLWMPTLPPSGV